MKLNFIDFYFLGFLEYGEYVLCYEEVVKDVDFSYKDWSGCKDDY